jgi:hypothetical protein
VYASENEQSWQERAVPVVRADMQDQGFATCFVMPAFPQGWAAQARTLIDLYPNLESEIAPDLRVLPGDDLACPECLPWLVDWYRGAALSVATTAFDRAFALPSSLSLGLQLYRLQGPSLASRWGKWAYGIHPCRIPKRQELRSELLCGLLFVNTPPEGAGGQLVLEGQFSSPTIIDVREGMLVLFDSTAKGYAFTPLEEGHSLYVATLRYVQGTSMSTSYLRAQLRFASPLLAEVG